MPSMRRVVMSICDESRNPSPVASSLRTSVGSDFPRQSAHEARMAPTWEASPELPSSRQRGSGGIHAGGRNEVADKVPVCRRGEETPIRDRLIPAGKSLDALVLSRKRQPEALSSWRHGAVSLGTRNGNFKHESHRDPRT